MDKGNSSLAARLPISVVIPVKNDDDNLRNCLESLKGFQDILVVDSSYSESAEKIAKQFNASYLDFKFVKPYPKKRNWALQNYAFENDWILFLDADELITDEFISELKCSMVSTNHNGYWLNYQIYFQGKYLRHGVAQRKLAMFKRSTGSYERILDEGWTNFDMEIHEHPIIDGSIGEIDARLLHMEDKPMLGYLNRNIEYAKWEAGRVGIIDNEAKAKFTFRQKIKYSMIRSPLLPVMYFLYTYIFKLGILDGRAGFRYAILKMTYFFQIYLLNSEIDKK